MICFECHAGWFVSESACDSFLRSVVRCLELVAGVSYVGCVRYVLCGGSRCVFCVRC